MATPPLDTAAHAAALPLPPVAPARRSSRFRDWALKAALAFGSVAAALVLCELTVRFFPRAFGIHAPLRYYMPHVFAAHPTITWSLQPGSHSPHQHFAGDFDVQVTVDARGFRQTPQEEGRPNLLLLGDSFTFGLGVEDDETFAAQLATRLPGWNVINAGYTGGAALDTQFVWLRENVRLLQPKLVLFQVFEANDYNEIADNVWTRVDEAGLPLAVRTRYYVKPGQKILSHHHRSLLRKTTALIRRSSYLGFLLVNKCEVFYFLTLPKLLGDTKHFEDTPETKRFADATFEKFKILFDGIRRHSAEHGYQYGFVLIPRTYWSPGTKLRLYKSQLIESHLKQQGVRFTTLNRLWEEKAAQIHLPNDAHYTEYGNKVVAEELHKWLHDEFPLPMASSPGVVAGR